MLTVVVEKFRDDWQNNHNIRNNEGQNNYQIENSHEKTDSEIHQGEFPGDWLAEREILWRNFLRENFLVPKLYLQINSFI